MMDDELMLRIRGFVKKDNHDGEDDGRERLQKLKDDLQDVREALFFQIITHFIIMPQQQQQQQQHWGLHWIGIDSTDGSSPVRQTPKVLSCIPYHPQW